MIDAAMKTFRCFQPIVNSFLSTKFEPLKRNRNTVVFGLGTEESLLITDHEMFMVT